MSKYSQLTHYYIVLYYDSNGTRNSNIYFFGNNIFLSIKFVSIHAESCRCYNVLYLMLFHDIESSIVHGH